MCLKTITKSSRNKKKKQQQSLPSRIITEIPWIPSLHNCLLGLRDNFFFFFCYFVLLLASKKIRQYLWAFLEKRHVVTRANTHFTISAAGLPPASTNVANFQDFTLLKRKLVGIIRVCRI